MCETELLQVSRLPDWQALSLRSPLLPALYPPPRIKVRTYS